MNEIKTTRTVGLILAILEEASDCGYDMDLLKTAVEIYEITQGQTCPYTQERCDKNCRNCEIWITNSGLCRSY